MECAIEKTLGVTQQCARDACPFWEFADGRMPERCLVQRFFESDLNDHEVAGWLVGLRRALERTHIEQGRLP
jgi:hypothetical protein